VRAPLRAAASVVVLCGLGAGAAEAGIAGTSGAITVIGAPQGTLASDTLESDTTVYAWRERLIAGPGAQNLDHIGAGTVSNGGVFGPNRPSPGTVTPQVAESYVIHFDQAGTGNATISNATITFDRPIIGVWHSSTGVNAASPGLNGTDAQWGPTGLTYGTLASRPYELGNGATSDRYSISTNLLTLTILNTYISGTGVDHLRVLVNPEPSTLALMGLGLAGLSGIVLRRRRRASRDAA
jgi:hypothetical protein